MTEKFTKQVKPVITCPLFESYAQLGESATITCEVEAIPGPIISWQYGDDHTRAEDIEELDEDGNALNGDKSEVTLEIELLDKSHFKNYYLAAENDIDQRELGHHQTHAGQKPGGPRAWRRG